MHGLSEKEGGGGEGRGCAEQSQIVHTNLTLRLGCRYVTV